MKLRVNVLQNSVQQEHLIPMDDKKMQDLKAAQNPFGAGEVFKKLIAAQLFQVEKQNAVDLQDIQLIHNCLLTYSEAWETAAEAYMKFMFDRVETGEHNFFH